ncbi:MAG TPA: NAD(P)/FAD-dependent oxidoreductase [Gemmataceae bacterium]|nr:NAD(P)/FAD-dependent oxidoreductase [Gemmataceae bacterium]
MSKRDAVVVGAGPNGLAAAIALRQRGRSVLVIAGAPTVGGGARSAELTLPGFTHDICSAVYPMALASPFLRSLPLGDHGLEWVHPTFPFAHPLQDGRAAISERSIETTAKRLGDDATAYARLFEKRTADADKLFGDLLGPLGIPRHPFAALRFGLPALRSGRGLAESRFRTEEARALIAGVAAHAVLPLEQRPGAAIALMLMIAGHAVGWPIVRGGAQRLSDALASYLRLLGGEVVTGQVVKSVDELPPSRAVFLDVTPRQLVALAGHRLPDRYKRRLGRYRYGPGVFKVDWALSAPIPWANAECRLAGTVHVGGTLDEVADAERAVFEGKHHPRPFVLVAQPSVFDSSRAPAGQHTGWAYCHVPNGSNVDCTAAIEAQVERFAPGFRDCILARHTHGPAELERYNPNCVGGDVTGGMEDLWQLFTRPVVRWSPYTTPNPELFLCSASTPPGGGVHGMCGFYAADAALRRVLK